MFVPQYVQGLSHELDALNDQDLMTWVKWAIDNSRMNMAAWNRIHERNLLPKDISAVAALLKPTKTEENYRSLVSLATAAQEDGLLSKEARRPQTCQCPSHQLFNIGHNADCVEKKRN